MNYLLKIFMIAVALVTAIPSFAVTDKEMEQARAIAAKHYLRYANNGSDYLDKLNPTSVGELSKSLRAKEQENIKSFNAVSVPKDYASWDKQKLVEYWSSTFFKAPGLKEDGKKCLSILAKNLNKMTVAAPSAAKPAEQPAQEAKPAESKPEPAATTQPTETPSAPASTAAPAPAENDVTSDESKPDQVEAAVAQADADAGLLDEQPKKSSNTGWYIGILVVLVGVVIWLVMYASKSMKETGSALSDQRAGEKEIRDAKKAAKEELNKMREQYASSLTAKNEEIKQLKAQCEELKKRLAVSEKRLADSDQRVAISDQRVAGSGQRVAGCDQRAAAKGGLPAVVYLSFVNQKGLFTKASRSLNAETSVYRMDIPDGQHGKFSVVSDPEVLERLIDDPGKWLGGGCVIENPEDADIAAEIVTLQTGEAVFADNTCRVTKKARIKFI